MSESSRTYLIPPLPQSARSELVFADVYVQIALNSLKVSPLKYQTNKIKAANSKQGFHPLWT